MNVSKFFATAICSAVFSAALSQDNRNVGAEAGAGKAVFEQNCLPCHQADGSGVPNLAPPLIKGTFVGGDKTRLIRIVLEGLQGVEINGEYYANPMPSFGFLSDPEIAAVLTFVRNNFSNNAEAVTIGEVQQVRKEK
jgi:mono/diheme cytochrome c family protein